MGSIVRHFYRRWVLASFGGWLLGIVVILLLAAVLEAVGIQGQSVLGIGMGMCVGYAQLRVGLKHFGATSRWMWASGVGMGAPFVLSDVLGALGMQWHGAELLVLPLHAAFGGLLTGVWQRRALPSGSPLVGYRWVAASTGGWVLAVATFILMAVPGHPNSALDAWRNVGSLALGGLVLGLVTGGALVRMLPSPSPAA